MSRATCATQGPSANKCLSLSLLRTCTQREGALAQVKVRLSVCSLPVAAAAKCLANSLSGRAREGQGACSYECRK